MKPIVQKVLESGLIDRQTAELMERYRMIPEGSSSIVKEDALKNATQAQLTKLAEELGAEVEKEHRIRETYLDLDKIRWPATVDIARQHSEKNPSFMGWDYDRMHAMAAGKPTYQYLASSIVGVVDRMGRYYFRIEDIEKEWIEPGHVILHKKGGKSMATAHTILESQHLFIDEAPVCWQVAVK